MHIQLSTESEGHASEHDLWLVRSGDTVEIEIDGETLEATVERTEDGTLIVTLGDREIPVQVTGDRTARVSGHRVTFEITAFEPGGAPGEHETLVAAEGAVRPPMPGKVSRLAVAQGDEVSQGQEVAVLEAMKMQSSIQAPRDGTVLRVHVTEGQAVDDKDLIMEIGDPDQA